jgi:carbamoyltransferase
MRARRYCLGLSAYFHDSAAALLRDGEIIAAAQEERFTRHKNDARFPAHAVAYCLSEAGIGLDQLDTVVFFEKPLRKFRRILRTFAEHAPHGAPSFTRATREWLGWKLTSDRQIRAELGALAGTKSWRGELLFSEHHLSHAASAFYPSPFEHAAVLTVDAVGEDATLSVAVGNGSKLEIVKQLEYPDSLGMLYSAFTYFTGFSVNSDEYKVMGLAPYGEPRYADIIREHLVEISEDGCFLINQDYFDYAVGQRMTGDRFDELFDGPARRPEDPLTRREMDLAASVQAVTSDIMHRLARSTRRETGLTNLCLAGGVALNCVINGEILSEDIFENIWIQPAAGDAGGALGAALAAHHLHFEQPRAAGAGDKMKSSLLGPGYSEEDIRSALQSAGAVFAAMTDERLYSKTVEALADGKVIGWFQGRMEFGPRALGARSILADPRAVDMQSTLNLKIKFRESFRPFAPIVKREAVSDWFDLDTDSPYMLIVAPVAAKRLRTVEASGLEGLELLQAVRSEIPSVTHVDGSARVQTVTKDNNARLYSLLDRFEAATGCPVLINTSFNVAEEPIVCSPADAFRCFMATDMDVLVIGNCFLEKPAQIAKRGDRRRLATASNPDRSLNYTVF